MHGYLSEIGKNSPLRFFVMSIKDQELLYYMDNTLEKEKGKINLVNSNIEIVNKEINGKSNCFTIKTSQKEYTMSALLKTDRMKWVGALDMCSHGVLSMKDDEIETIYEDTLNQDELVSEGNSKRQSSKGMTVSVPMAACCGWIEKNKRDDHGRTSWKRRWLVLTDPRYSVNHFLFYFESDAHGGSNKKGEIALYGSSRVEKNFKGKKKNVFVVSTTRDGKSVEFEIACPTFEECNIWVRQISKAITTMQGK